MHGEIQLLSDETINQIAAGEVIESPASVIKELIENAVDAGAKKIAVEMAGGGLKSIRIVDDGIGMDRENARRSILRHATSKILKPQDLFRISTKGFRGEALASIASISKMTLTTAKEKESGTKLEIERGEIIKEGPAARKPGTTIEVRSLFYNVPARKKFQKTPAAISAEVFRLVTVMALSEPEVHFELISNGRRAIQTKSEGLQERAKELIGVEFCEKSFPLHFSEEGLSFQGLIGTPSNNRNNRLGQYLFLNKRAVSCAVISDAIREGYGTRMDEKRHPIFLLHLDVPPDLVDINVHPQKLQVRLRKEELFRDKVAQAVVEALALRPKAEKLFEKPVAFVPRKQESFEPISFKLEEEPVMQQDLQLEEAFEPMGQSGRFFFLKTSEGVRILDLQAARSRICYEEILAKGCGRGIKQGLLVPFHIELTSVESAMVLTHQEAIEAVGFTLKATGKDMFMVEAIPPFVQEQQVQGLLADMAKSLQEFIGKIDYEKARRERLAYIASKHIPTRKHYSHEEVQKILKKLQSCEDSLHALKGNPITVELSDECIEDLFSAPAKAAKRP